jgi:hypothetical protein
VTPPHYFIELRKPDGTWRRDWSRGPWANYSTAVRHATEIFNEPHQGVAIIDMQTGRVTAFASRYLSDSEHYHVLKGFSRYLRSVRSQST